MLKQASVVSSVVLFVFAGQMALAGPVLDIDSDLMSAPRGGVVFEQLPNRTSGQASDSDFITDTGLPFWQLEADNVQLSESAIIRRITWWGFYGLDFDKSPDAHDPPDRDETMQIRLYSARVGDGLPNSYDILFEQSFLNPTRTATGRTLLLPGIPAEYQFQVDLGSPLNLDSNVLYWLEVAQVGDQSSLFRWERGIGLINGRAFSNPIVPDWQGTTGSFAFSLSAIPEPSSLSLLSLCVAPNLLLGRGGRRVARR
jgi:hypothetical protein